MRAGRAFSIFLWGCSSLFFSCSASAADEVAQWFERMVNAAHQLNYIGTFVYQQDGVLQTMHVVHGVDDEGEHERLVSLSGPAREVLRERDKVTCILPEESSMVVEHAGPPQPFPQLHADELELLRRHYDIRLMGKERIAGMRARQIAITPRDQYRYGQNIWLSEDHGLLLKAEVIDEQGELVEQVMFTSLEIREQIPPAMLEPQTENPAKVIELAQTPEPPSVADNARAEWQVKDLPQGFTQKMHRLHYLPQKSRPVEHHLYSDGLASVSVFIEPGGEDDEGLTGPSHLGGVNAYSRRFGEHRATVVGEVPPVTVKRIAESIQPLGGEGADD